MLRTTLLLSSLLTVLFLSACPPPAAGEGEGEGAAGEGEGAAGEGEGAGGEGEGVGGEGEGEGAAGEGEGEGAAGEGEGEGAAGEGEGEGAGGEGEGEGAPPAECLTPTAAIVGNNNGDTTGGGTGLVGSNNEGCLADPTGTEQVWSFTPSHSGELTITVTPATGNTTSDFGFYVRSACGDETTNLAGAVTFQQQSFSDGCIDFPGAGAAESAVYEVGTGPLFIVVDTADDATSGNPIPGAYTLAIDFTPSNCGDTQVTGTEQCDGTNFNGGTCADFVPATSGTLTCKSDCTVDSSACTPVCVAGNEKTAAIGANTGDTTQGTNALSLGCDAGAFQQGDTPGNEQIWTFTPTQTGFVDLTVAPANNAQLDFALETRTACDDDNSETECSDSAPAGQSEALQFVPVTANAPITIVVKSFLAADNGAYTLNVAFTAVDEVEPNDTTATANAITLANGTKDFIGLLSPAGDVDCVSFTVDPNKTIKAEVGDGGDGRCANSEIDSFVAIFDSTDPNAAPLASNDDIDNQNGNLCSSATTTAQATGGTKFVCVSASPQPQPGADTFEYVLTVTVQ